MGEYDIRLLQPEEYAAWDKLQELSSQGSLYSKTIWLEAIAKAYKLKYCVYGCYKKNQLVGGVGLFYIEKWKKKVAFSPPLTPYTGMVISEETGKNAKILSRNMRVAEQLIPVLEKDFDYIKLVHHWGLKDIRPFTWGGWASSVHYSYLIPLANLDGLYASLDKRDRKPIKTAESMGFTCRRDTDYEDFHRLFALTFIKQNMPVPVSRETFLQLVMALSSQQACRLYLVKNIENKNIAGMVVLTDSSGAHAWLGGTDPDYLNSGATPFLFWHIFRDLASEYPVFDLDGANIKTIARFKKNMGGILVPYYTTTKINSSLLRMTKIAKEISRIWK